MLPSCILVLELPYLLKDDLLTACTSKTFITEKAHGKVSCTKIHFVHLGVKFDCSCEIFFIYNYLQENLLPF